MLTPLAEEGLKSRRFPGIAFRDNGAHRRPWIIGTGLDVWEVIHMLEDFGSIDQLVADTQLTERHILLAMEYREEYPEEIATAIATNRMSVEEWKSLYPHVIFSGDK